MMRIDSCLRTAVERVEDLIAESAREQKKKYGQLTHIIKYENTRIIHYFISPPFLLKNHVLMPFQLIFSHWDLFSIVF